ncbi:MAG: hypothetical protein EP216_01655 [Epsilonproteobacteria bacterium]|nr:MAG: hypothetical protein EP216_01655 [Campylobacterota bacterium]
MSNENLLYIEDENNRKLFYRFTPAAIVSNFVPLVVILDEKEKAEATHFEYKMWNILTPLDNYGYEGLSSCWLGEKGDFFVKDLLQKLIHDIAEEYECEDHIYLYGSSMGGYGAILHGILCKANAVYAHNPHIRLNETNVPNKENDLTHFLNSTDTFPVFYLCDDDNMNEPDLKDDTAYFVDACKKYNIKVHPDYCSKIEDDETQVLKEVLDFFARIASEG